MKINGETQILELKERFSKAFLGLKLEFYKSLSESYGKEDVIVNDNLTLADINPTVQAQNVTWAPDRTVGELEEEFKEKLGIKMQIFRRSKDIWIQTTKTDDWTIQVQNDKGIHSTQTK